MKQKLRDFSVPPLLTLIILGCFFMLYGLFPFGENAIAWCDMKQQVIPILLNFKDILESPDLSILYSPSNAGGMNFWGVFLFFISSPVSFLVLFWDKSDMMQMMNIMVALKMAVCALTASIFFYIKLKKVHWYHRTLLSLMYAFSGYAMLYFQNMVWLDMMYIFPVLLLGIERMTEKNKPLLYIFSLTSCMIVNFYLSYMSVMFIILASALYLLFRYPKEKRGKYILTFIISSIVSALLTAVIWLPAFVQYMGSGRGVKLTQSLSSGSFFKHCGQKLCFIFCTSAILGGIPVLLSSGRLKKRNVKYYGLLFILLFIPVIVSPINKMWHTGSYQSFPYRYGYMTTFIGLILVGTLFKRQIKPSASPKVKIIAVFLSLISVTTYILAVIWFYCNKLSEMSKYTSSLVIDKRETILVVILGIFAIIAYMLPISFYYIGFYGKHILSVFLTIIFITETFMNLSMYMGSAGKDDKLYRAVIDTSNAVSDDESYYRVKAEKKYTYANMVGATGFNSLAHYTSLTDEKYQFAMKKLGYSSYWMEVNSNCGTRLTDALLANKYSIGTFKDISAFKETVYSNSTFIFMRNDICLDVGLLLDDIDEIPETINFDNRIDIQKRLARQFLGSDNMITCYSPDTTENLEYNQLVGTHSVIKGKGDSYIGYEIDVKGTQTLYFDLFNTISTELKEKEYGSTSVYVNGQSVSDDYPNQLKNGFLELGTFRDETVNIKIVVKNNFNVRSFGVFGIDLEKLDDAVKNNVEDIDVKQENNRILANVNTDKKWLYLSIPYANGFSAKVNNKPVEIKVLNDCFMAVPLEQGENNIVFTFVPSGFKVGALASAIGLVSLIGYIILSRRKYSLPAWLSKVLNILMLIAFWGVIAVIYVMPVAVYIIFHKT